MQRQWLVSLPVLVCGFSGEGEVQCQHLGGRLEVSRKVKIRVVKGNSEMKTEMYDQITPA